MPHAAPPATAGSPLPGTSVPTWRPPEEAHAESATRSIWFLFWVYVFLLIFEGAARKWMIPKLSGPLLVIRDPIVILIYWYALRAKLFPVNGWTISLIVLAILSFCAGLFSDRGSPVIAAYGARANFFHMPMIFIIGRIANRDQVIKVGRWLLLISIPLAVLMVLQFRSPGDALVNSSTNEGGSQLSGALGRIRPAATFSFHTGAGEFICLVASFLIYFVLEKRRAPLWLVAGGGAALLLSLAVSVSRYAVISTGFIFFVALFISLVQLRYLPRLLAMFAFFVMILVALLPFGIVQEGSKVFSTRLEQASTIEGGTGGFVDRVTRGFTGPADEVLQAPWLGYGLGLGTMVGSRLKTGTLGFELSEDEWMRILLESGPILGIYFLIWRFALFVALFYVSWKALWQGNILPMLIYSASWYLVVNGHLGQSTSMGFAVVGASLCLAALRVAEPAPQPRLA